MNYVYIYAHSYYYCMVELQCSQIVINNDQL
jgi:hypothetical protein